MKYPDDVYRNRQFRKLLEEIYRLATTGKQRGETGRARWLRRMEATKMYLFYLRKI